MKKELITALILVCSSFVLAQCPEGIISYWKLDQTTGPVVDSINGNNGTVVGDVSRGLTGQLGNSFSFDGDNDYLNMGNDPSLHISPTQAYTFEYWVKSTSSDQMQIRDTIITGSGLIYPAGQLNRPTEGDIQVWVGSPGKNLIVYSDDTGWNDGNWHHFAITKEQGSDANLVKVYYDGSEIPLTVHRDQKPVNLTYGGDVLWGGLNYDGVLSGNFNGSFDEIAFYDRALNSSEVLDHYNNGLNDIDYCGVLSENEQGVIPEVGSNPMMAVLAIAICAIVIMVIAFFKE